MSSAIVLPAKFDASLCSISQPKMLESGGKMAYLNYNGDKTLTIQTPSLPSPFGLNIFDKAGPPKYSLDLAMRGYQDNSKVKAFFKALSDLDEYMIEQGVKNSKLWFKSDMKKEVVSAFYTPCVKFGRDKEGNQTPYPPNVKLNLKKARGSNDFDCSFFDASFKQIKGIPLEEMLVKKVEVTALMQCTGVWFAGGKFGLSWKAVQIRLDKVPAGMGNIGFVDDDGEPIGSGSNAVATIGGAASFAEPAEFSSRPAKKAPVVADSDEEEEEQEEHAPAPVPAKAAPASAPAPAPVVADSDEEEEHAPAPVPKKTVITKKKIVTGSTKK